MSTGAVMEATEGKRNDALAGRHGGGLVARFEQRGIAAERVLQRRFEPLRFRLGLSTSAAVCADESKLASRVLLR